MKGVARCEKGMIVNLDQVNQIVIREKQIINFDFSGEAFNIFGICESEAQAQEMIELIWNITAGSDEVRLDWQDLIAQVKP